MNGLEVLGQLCATIFTNGPHFTSQISPRAAMAKGCVEQGFFISGYYVISEFDIEGVDCTLSYVC